MDDYIKRKDIHIALDSHYFTGELSLKETIDSVPSADVRPVMRGKWLQDCDYHFRCSVCGDRWTVSNGNPLDISNGWNYCPNCGAQMEES